MHLFTHIIYLLYHVGKDVFRGDEMKFMQAAGLRRSNILDLGANENSNHVLFYFEEIWADVEIVRKRPTHRSERITRST